MKKIIFKILLLFLFIFGCFSFSNANASEYIIYKNEDDGFLYKKNANDISNGSAITSVNSIFPSYSPDGQYIIYKNHNDGGKLYRKNANDASNGSAITSVNSTSPSYFPDGQYIIYTNDDDGGKLYKKNADDASNGTAITSVSGTYNTFSPDGQYIIYTNRNDGMKLYKKNADDASNGTAITSVFSVFSTYSPDGQYIVYRNGNDMFLYKKNANDISNGSAITSVISTSPSYSLDGQYIVYTNLNDGGKLYKKNANDTSNGSAITSVNSTYPTFSPIAAIEIINPGTISNIKNGFKINNINVSKDYNIEREIRKYDGIQLVYVDDFEAFGFSFGTGSITILSIAELESFASYRITVKYINSNNSDDFIEQVYNHTYVKPAPLPDMQVLDQGNITSISNGFRINNVNIDLDYRVEWVLDKIEGIGYNYIDNGILFGQSAGIGSFDITTLTSLENFGQYRLTIDYTNDNAPNSPLQIIYTGLYVEPYEPDNISLIDPGNITSISNGFRINDVNINLNYRLFRSIWEIENGTSTKIDNGYKTGLAAGTGSFNITTSVNLKPFQNYEISIDYIYINDRSQYISKKYNINYVFNEGYTPPTEQQFIFSLDTFYQLDNGFFYNSIPDPYGGAFYFDIIAPDPTGAGTINLTTQKYYDYSQDGNGYGLDGGIRVTFPYHEVPGQYRVKVYYEYNNITVELYGGEYQIYNIIQAERTSYEGEFNTEIEGLYLCDTDLDGVIGIGEALACPFKTIEYYSKEVFASIMKLKDFFVQLMKIGTDEVKTFSFIPGVHANFMDSMGSIESQDPNYLQKMYFFLKGFLFFTFLILAVILIIVFKQK